MDGMCLIWKSPDGDVVFPLVGPGPISLGRGDGCDIALGDRKVSRSHARLDLAAGSWLVRDAGSQAGTMVNGRRLEGGDAVALVPGDLLQVGPVTLEARAAGASAVTLPDGEVADMRAYEPIERRPMRSFDHEQLSLLLELSERIHADATESDMRRRLVDAVARATRFANVAFVRPRPVTDGVDVLESVGETTDRTGRPRMSRTMLRNAREGSRLVLDRAGAGDAGIEASLERAAVNQAFCIPVGRLGCHGFLYADNGSARGDASDRARIELAGRVADALVQRAASEFDRIEHRRQSERLWRETLHSFVDTLECRDAHTGAHSRRVARMALLVARAAGLDEPTCTLIEESARVHDIGKVAIDDAILRAPRPLTDSEMAIVRTHPRVGHDILARMSSMRELLPGVLEHHERWDGRGYPQGLKGESISPLGRVLAVADAFDAMTSERPYRPAFPMQDARARVVAESGRQFDPRMVEAFARISDAELRVAMSLQGDSTDSAD
jgi:HD-GYP domain-containing protein (c-di-GMP phosphodiesterase class II)